MTAVTCVRGPAAEGSVKIKLNKLELLILLDLFKLVEEHCVKLGPVSKQLRKRLQKLAK